MSLTRVTLADLTIEDEQSFSHVGLYADLKSIVLSKQLAFLVPRQGSLSWDLASFLNHTYWEPGTADVLTSRAIEADVVMHVAWHALAAEHLLPSVGADLLGESIASAFDVYLVGRLLSNRPDSPYLESQVPRMAEAAEHAGLSERGFEQLLERIAEEPERAFGELQSLLYETSLALTQAASASDAVAALDARSAHPFSALLFHFELSTWVNRSRAVPELLSPDRPSRSLKDSATIRRPPAPGIRPPSAPGAPEHSPEPERRADAASIASALRGAENAVDWLDRNWVRSALGA